jgi:gamma-glutamyltranspeptidase / glutathione hydrolase
MKRALLRLALFAAGLTAALGGAPAVLAKQPHKTPTAVGTGGAAASVDTLATDAAIHTLRKGGNAVDAAVAAAGVLGVVEPFSCGIGGGGFMVIRTADGDVTTIDGRETAPAAMEEDSFWQNGAPLAFDPARFSGMSAGVPGTPETWAKALRQYGTISLRQALKPGIKVAKSGYTVDQTFFDAVQAVQDYFDDIPSTARIYLDRDGTPRDVGSRIRNRDMAEAYQLIARKGVREGFYEGPIARAMVAAATNPPKAADANHPWLAGKMTTADLSAYQAPERAPTVSRYRGLDVYGMGPPSSGGSTVGEVLNILDGYNLSAASRVQALHWYLEASRFTFADRNAYLADPAYFDVPLEGLLSESFADERRAEIDDDTAATSPVPAGDPYDDQGSASRPAANSATIAHPRQSTTHLTVADRHGNVVSYTFTIESTGGNGIVVPGWGFLLNNELTDFNYDSLDHPNKVEGGKRPRSSMAPTIIERDGEPFLALGSPGGSTIPGTVLQMIVNRLDFGATLPQAIAAPRAVERNTATTQAEKAFIDSPEGRTLDAAPYNHDFALPPGNGEIGAATGIEFSRHGFLAAAEPVRRGGGSAMVVKRAH